MMVKITSNILMHIRGKHIYYSEARKTKINWFFTHDFKNQTHYHVEFINGIMYVWFDL